MIALYCRGTYTVARRVCDAWICANCGREVRNVVA